MLDPKRAGVTVPGLQGNPALSLPWGGRAPSRPCQMGPVSPFWHFAPAGRAKLPGGLSPVSVQPGLLGIEVAREGKVGKLITKGEVPISRQRATNR